jgi:predicted  nucleic acid-binding Zn-ribbon protein
MLLDSWCDDLALLERATDRELPSVFTSMRQHVGELSHAAVERGWDAAVRVCETLERLCDAVETKSSTRDDRFFELAYAFGGIYAEGAQEGEGPGVLNWISECDDLLDFERARPVARPKLKTGAPDRAGTVAGASPAAASPFEEEPSEGAAVQATAEAAPSFDSSLDADDLAPSLEGAGATGSRPSGEDRGISELLETARKAAAKGSHVDAKLLAMQAALSIAKTQTQEAEGRVRQAEMRIQDGVRSIDGARQQIGEIEAQVGQAELQVDECRKELAERGRHTQGVQTGVDGLHARLAELERRLRELQEQIDVAQRQRVAAEEALAEAMAQESRARQALDGAIQQEDASRARLEEARQNLKALQRRQGNYEAVMERAREALARQRDSVKDIESTITQIRSTEAVESDEGEELLF